MSSLKVFSFYLLIAIQSYAVIVSAITVTALSIPFLTQLKNGSFNRRTTAAQRRRGQPTYSIYNLYLVYLSIVDLAYLLPTIAAELSAANQTSHPRLWSALSWMMTVDDTWPDDFGFSIESLIILPYTVANLWINAVIAYQVLILLRRSQLAQRINQPSLTMVTLQGFSVIFCSVLIGVLFYYNWINRWVDMKAAAPIIMVTILIPFVLAIGVTILVIWRGYIPSLNGSSTLQDRAVRGLALYFFRVFMVFVGIWLPATILVVLYGLKILQSAYIPYCGCLLMAIQPIFTFYMILHKDDVKEYITDTLRNYWDLSGLLISAQKILSFYIKYIMYFAMYFATLISCWKNRNATPDESNENTDDEDPETANEEPHQRSGISILGFSFPDVDDDSVHDIEAIGDVASSVDDNKTADVDSDSDDSEEFEDTDESDNTNSGTRDNNIVTKNKQCQSSESTAKSIGDDKSCPADLELGGASEESLEDEKLPAHYGTRSVRAVFRRIAPDGEITVTTSSKEVIR